MANQKREQAKRQSLPAKQKVAAPPESQTQVVTRLLSKAAGDLKSRARKATLADYIKLIQLQKDLDVEEPRDIKVGWVDHLEKDGEK